MVCKGEKIVSYSHDNVIEKINKLKYRITFATHGTQEPTELKDVMWCKRLLDDVENSGLVPSKEEFIMANLMWKKYNDNGGVEPTNENMWELIDGMLTQENPTKIGAIKIYRRFVNSTLREAKDMVHAREIKIQKGW